MIIEKKHAYNPALSVWKCSPESIRILLSSGLVFYLEEGYQEVFGKMYIYPILQARTDIYLKNLKVFCPNATSIPQGAIIHQDVLLPRVVSNYIKKSQPRGTHWEAEA